MGNALHVRMTEEDYAEIQKAAGDNLSEWARKILLAEARKDRNSPAGAAEAQGLSRAQAVASQGARLSLPFRRPIPDITVQAPAPLEEREAYEFPGDSLPRRLKTLVFTQKQLLRTFVRYRSGYPDHDATVIAVSMTPDGVKFTIRSNSFPVVDVGEPIPELPPRFAQ